MYRENFTRPKQTLNSYKSNKVATCCLHLESNINENETPRLSSCSSHGEQDTKCYFETITNIITYPSAVSKLFFPNKLVNMGMSKKRILENVFGQANWKVEH